MNVAFGWYTPKTWARLHEVVADPYTLAGSYEAFLVGAGENIKAIAAQGLAITKVMIDPDHMV